MASDNYQNFYDGAAQYNDWNPQPQIDPVAIEQLENADIGALARMPPAAWSTTPRPSGKAHNVSAATGTGTPQGDDPDSTGAINEQLAYRLRDWPGRRMAGR